MRDEEAGGMFIAFVVIFVCPYSRRPRRPESILDSCRVLAAGSLIVTGPEAELVSQAAKA